jgi:hypothetical protein
MIYVEIGEAKGDGSSLGEQKIWSELEVPTQRVGPDKISLELMSDCAKGTFEAYDAFPTVSHLSHAELGVSGYARVCQSYVSVTRRSSFMIFVHYFVMILHSYVNT